MRKILCVGLLSLLVSGAQAAENAEAESNENVPQAYTWDNLLTMETITNFNGINESGSRYLMNLDVTFKIDTGLAGWWGNGTFFVYGLADWGQNPSELTGELQTLSNIEAPNSAKIYEFYYEHSFLHGDAKVLIGLHDHNASFYALDAAELFSESAFGIGPEAAQATPSIFPTTSMTALLSVSHNNFYGKIAIYDGVPGDPKNPRGTHLVHGPDDGLYNAEEFGYEADHDWKVGLGAWQHSAKVQNPVDGKIDSSNGGFYLIGQKYFENDLAIFMQMGRANPQKNQLSEYLGTGFTQSNLWMKGDQFGVGYAKATNSPDFLKNNPDLLKAETVLEASYLWPLSDSINAQASFYNIDHPSMMKDQSNTMALGLRLYVAF